MKAFTETAVNANKKWFEDVYGDKKLHLRVLGTHPGTYISEKSLPVW